MDINNLSEKKSSGCGKTFDTRFDLIEERFCFTFH